MHRILCVTALVALSLGSDAPIRIIDIFTNYPDTNEVLKEYSLIRSKRTNETGNVAEARNYYDYYDRYDNHKYYTGGVRGGDQLESEFGVFDASQHEENDDFVYVQGEKVLDYVPVRKKHDYEEDDTDSFKHKLNKFMAQVQKKPDELHFSNNGLIPAEDNVDIESEYGEIVRKPAPAKKRRKKRPLQVKPNLPQLNSTNRNRVTNMMRKYLVRMHKKKGRKVNKDRTFNAVPFNKKTEYNVAYQLPDTQGKFLSHPLEHLKNKTKLFANKFLSLFTIIQFANSKCQASNSLTEYEGTCYLATECEQMNGIAMGNCADGHGVCCVFKGTCGGVGSNNCTYFESPGYPNYFPENGGVVVPPETTTTNPNTPDPRLTFLVRQGRADDDLANALSCIYKVYKSSDNIKQMRIDFIDLELKGPTNGVCVDEKLVISGSGLNTMVPILCGYNTGQHIYVDVESLSGPLQIAVLANNIERKRYKMKICQYDDSCSGLMSCLQYYTGISGVISSFNYEKAATFSRSDPQYLNNLNYAICIKREPGYCTVTYRTTGNNVQYPFELKNFDEDGMPTVPNGQAGVGVINCPDDYIVVNGIRLCGDRLNDGSVEEDFSLNAPVTDMSNGPIVIPVKTSGSGTGRGFKLFYMQNKCGNGNGMGGGNVPDPRT